MLDQNNHWVAFDPKDSAKAAKQWQMRDVRPSIWLREQNDGQEFRWYPQYDLLNSDRFDRNFVVETEDDGRAYLRFGDNALGKQPESTSTFSATYRFGNGRLGNVGADAIHHIFLPNNSIQGEIMKINNPLPAEGGIEPESIEQVRLLAPQAFREQQRAVTADDYARITERFPGVQKTEGLSVLELARAIGYELNPGVAASTSLTFLVDDSPGSPGVSTVPKGTVIKSIPGEGEKSQTFETDTTIIARADWNNLQPRASKPQKITSTTKQIYLQGTNTQLQAGDRILLLDQEGENIDQYLLTLTDVAAILEAGSTRVTWEDSSPAIPAPLRNPKVFAFRKQAALFGNNAPRWDSLPNEIKRSNGGTMRGGVFRRNEQGSSWIASSGDLADPKSLLPTIDILVLAVNQKGYLFAGTTGSGIFRSLDNGQTWSAVNTGLTNQNIQSLCH